MIPISIFTFQFDLDFRRKYPEQKISIEWEDFVSATLKLTANVKDKAAKNLLEQSTVTASDKMVLALKLIPFLLPVQRSKKSAGIKYPSKLEVSEKFISHFNVHTTQFDNSIRFD